MINTNTENVEITGVVAVHCGAGVHKSKYYHKYNRLSKQACRKGIEIIKNNGSALDAVKAVIKILEDDPLTNSGYGSNLTSDGCVEGDASVMDGKTLTYGSCGAVKNVKNPIELAYDICIKQFQSLPLGLIPPSFLVGTGATKYAKSAGLKIVKKKALISPKAISQYTKYKKLVNNVDKDEELLDTVGAVCVDKYGYVAAGCSSGGILLKKSGRVGQAAVYGCGVWADSFNKETEDAVAVSTTGCGEHLVRTHLAKEIAEDIKNSSCPTLGLSHSVTNKFLNSRYLRDTKQKLCGALVLHINHESKDIAILWAHTTETMSIGFMSTADEKPKGLISELPKEVAVGNKVNVSGTYIYTKTDRE